MDIWTEFRFNDYFAWQFTERERKLPEAKEFVEQVKNTFAHKTERMYFREENRWLIKKACFIDFMDLYCQFVKSYVFKQSEMGL